MIGFTAPHSAATDAGLAVLQQGGTAIEAMVAAAATIAVVYPHMNGLGGDGFWLISEPGKAPVAIDAAGCAAQNATPEFYQNYQTIPSRGPLAALTIAGAVAGWQKALDMSNQWQQAYPLEDLLNHAIQRARNDINVTQSLEDASNKTFADFARFKAFTDTFTLDGQSLKKGQTLHLNKLADTLAHLGKAGLADFYHGAIAAYLAEDLATSGSPITLRDFQQFQARQVTPLSVDTSIARLYNLPAPTQGLASLMILALFDRVKHLASNETEAIHLLIECTKQAFIVRNATITDQSRLTTPQQDWLTDEQLNRLANDISTHKALPWPHVAKPGDTIWMGACDEKGRMVSYIQSLYWEFGSGVVSPKTGIVWNNRGTSFSLDNDSLQYLQPGLKPFHTLNPAYAEYHNGERMVYGTMGGEGQPQTQAALFSRFSWLGHTLQDAIAQPRWLLGRTWGDVSHNLKIEQDLGEATIQHLKDKGHDTALVTPRSEMMGHAGAVHLSHDGKVNAATDPRSDGKASTDNIRN